MYTTNVKYMWVWYQLILQPKTQGDHHIALPLWRCNALTCALSPMKRCLLSVVPYTTRCTREIYVVHNQIIQDAKNGILACHICPGKVWTKERINSCIAWGTGHYCSLQIAPGQLYHVILKLVVVVQGSGFRHVPVWRFTLHGFELMI